MIYDLAVIGCGGIGSAVLFHAAHSGAKVIGIEQFEPAHNRGSSHGHTRIIRQAYFEHPNYVPLLLEAYEFMGRARKKSPVAVVCGDRFATSWSRRWASLSQACSAVPLNIACPSIG